MNMTLKYMRSFDSYSVRVKESQRRYRMIVDEVLFANEPDRIKLRNANFTAREKRHRIEIVYGTQCAQWILDELRYVAPKQRGPIQDWLDDFDVQLARENLTGAVLSSKHLAADHFSTGAYPDLVPIRHWEPRPYQKAAIDFIKNDARGGVLFNGGRRLPRYLFSTPQVTLKDLADFDHPFEKKVLELTETYHEVKARSVGNPRAITQLPFLTTQVLGQWLRNNSVRK
jgi:hypothetical protein